VLFWQWYARIEGVENYNANIACDSCGNIYVSCIILAGNTADFYDKNEDLVMTTGPMLDTSILLAKMVNGKWEWFNYIQPYVDIDETYMHNMEVSDDIYIRFNLPESYATELRDVDLNVNLSVGAITGKAQQPLVSCSKDGYWKSVKTIYVEEEQTTDNKIVRTKFQNGNIYAIGSTEAAPEFVDRDAETRIIGRAPTNGQVFIAKVANEDSCNINIGVVLRITGDNAVIQTGGRVIYNQQVLVPGTKYYLKCGEGTEMLPSLVDEEYSDGHKNRYIGVAVASNIIQLGSV
jgi:hypothetical protein